MMILVRANSPKKKRETSPEGGTIPWLVEMERTRSQRQGDWKMRATCDLGAPSSTPMEVAGDERRGLGEQAVWVSQWSPGRVAGGRRLGNARSW
jgi:hypothetical protein